MKQGSGGVIKDSGHINDLYADFIEYADNLYYRLMDLGVAPEMARLVLPGYSMYVRWRWTASLQASLHFVSLRLGHGAQQEIAQYASAVNDIVKDKFPVTHEAWNKYRI